MNKTRELQTARGHTMPPPLHLSDIRYKYFSYRRSYDKEKGAMNERTSEVGCWKILYIYNSPVNEKILYKLVNFVIMIITINI